MTIAPPAPPYLGPAAHTSSGSNKPIDRIVIHCTVSGCVYGGARDIARYFRSQSAGGSAHYTVDPGEAIQSVYDGVIAWHAPPNGHSLGVELCDPMTGPDSRWQDKNHEAMLQEAAVLVAQLCLAYGVPIVRLSVADLKAGKRGICGHVDVSGAFKQSSHWDPGPAFPWKHFMDLVRKAAANLQAPTTTTPAPKPISQEDEVTPADIAKIADAVLNSPVTNTNVNGTKSTTTLRKIITNIEIDQDRTNGALARIEETLKGAIAGKS